MTSDHGRQFKPIELGHADVYQQDGDVVLKQILKRVLTGTYCHEVFVQVFENNLVRHQLCRLIVDKKNCDLIVFGHL